LVVITRRLALALALGQYVQASCDSATGMRYPACVHEGTCSISLSHCERKCGVCTGTVWWSVRSECVVYVPVQYDGQLGAKVWCMYRYCMMVSQERMCGVCTGVVWWSVRSECTVYVPVQYDGQSGANVWRMYRYSMMVSQERMHGFVSTTCTDNQSREDTPACFGQPASVSTSRL